jgi:AAA+ ATPase superfamily predicted ATPase
MKQYGSRMELIPVRDLPKDKALDVLRKYRKKSRYKSSTDKDAELFEEVYKRVGGRLAFLSKVANSEDMLAKCDDICENEKKWFLVCGPDRPVG